MSSSRPSAPPAGRQPGGAPPCPCSPGCGCELDGRPAAPHRHRPRADDLRRGRRSPASGDGVVGPPGPPGLRHRPGAPRGQRRGRGRRDDEARITAGRSEFSLRILPADEFPRLRRADRRRRSPWPARSWPRALSPGGAGGLERRRPADPHRRAPGRRGRWPAPRRHRLVPAGGPRPARHAPCWPRASTSSCRRGRCRSWPACSPAADTLTRAAGGARRQLRGRRHAAHHRASSRASSRTTSGSSRRPSRTG